jgi:Patatin-like phospholipase
MISSEEANATAGPPPDVVMDLVTDFARVYAAEYADIKGWARANEPLSVNDRMSGLALSGGGIRSASFGLGVLQALNAEGILKNFDYLSTVSGGGYIGTSMTVSMSSAEIEARKKVARRPPAEGRYKVPWRFPFGKTGEEVGETDETRHLRDRSRYLLQNGATSALSALVIYLRGIAMNVLIVLPLLLLMAAFLALCKPDTRALVNPPSWLSFLPQPMLQSGWPLSICAAGIFALFLIVYALAVSVIPILRKAVRQEIAEGAAVFFVICALPILVEAHFALLKVLFGPPSLGIETSHADSIASGSSSWFSDIKRAVGLIMPFVFAALPFLRRISEKAVTAATTSFLDAASKWTSRIVLLIVAAVVPLLLWLSTLQLAYWAIAVNSCDVRGATACAPPWGANSWAHSPPFLDWLFRHVGAFVPVYGASAAYAILAGVQLIFWLFLNVNSNSLHQLYRDRLGSAFLFRRDGGDGALEGADQFMLSEIAAEASPYHLINAALNVPGSRFANRRGRNADFFLFSKRFVGSELTGYVDTRLAEAAMDGLNAGTAMAISGAAAAPNMGMASTRPLSPTIALLNVRLGRWMRHPYDVVKYAKTSKFMQWWRGRPGPTRLLSEAFFKSGADVTEKDERNTRDAGFVFLTDGGHIENLGVYELLRRRCSLVVAVDAEADPNYNFPSLVQLERFARIDLGIRIVLDWQPIAERSRLVSKGFDTDERYSLAGPHVAIGLIDYPSAATDGAREQGVLIYIKSSMSGDENDYVADYKKRNPDFPQESTMEQLFSEEQLEAYRALGEHIGRRFCRGEDEATVVLAHGQSLVAQATRMFPKMRPALVSDDGGAA